MKFSDIHIILFGTIEHFLSYLFNSHLGLFAAFLRCFGLLFFRIVVSSSDRVHDLYL